MNETDSIHSDSTQSISAHESIAVQTSVSQETSHLHAATIYTPAGRGFADPYTARSVPPEQLLGTAAAAVPTSISTVMLVHHHEGSSISTATARAPSHYRPPHNSSDSISTNSISKPTAGGLLGRVVHASEGRQVAADDDHVASSISRAREREGLNSAGLGKSSAAPLLSHRYPLAAFLLKERGAAAAAGGDLGIVPPSKIPRAAFPAAVVVAEAINVPPRSTTVAEDKSASTDRLSEEVVAADTSRHLNNALSNSVSSSLKSKLLLSSKSQSSKNDQQSNSQTGARGGSTAAASVGLKGGTVQPAVVTNR